MLAVGDQQQAALYNDFNTLAKLKREAAGNSAEALKATARQFEALFVNQMLKSMREANLGEGLFDSENSKLYQEMYDQQLSVELTQKSSIGLADMIVKQLGGEGLTEAGVKPERNLADYRRAPVAMPQPITDQTDFSTKTATDAVKHFASPKAFIDHLYPAAQDAGRRLGVDPKLLLAQAALETGWGKSIIQRGDSSSFNLFNIKAGSSWQGNKARVATLEYDHGVVQKIHADFRAYDSYQDSFNDYARLLLNNRRYADAVSHAGNPDRFAHSLQQGGYATDPNYAKKLLSIYRGETLSGWQPPLTLAQSRE